MDRLRRQNWVILLLAFGVGSAFVIANAWAEDEAATPARHHSHGLKFKPAETYRGFERTSVTRGLALPPAADLSALFPPAKNQGDQSSCVGWSVSYGLRGYYANKAGQGVGGGGSAAPVLLSPSFVYNQIADPGACADGSNISDALDLLRDVGTVPLSRFPYREGECSRLPSPDIKREASAWRIRAWRVVDLNNLGAIKEQIAKGDPVVIGMNVNDAFDEVTGPTVYRDARKDGDGHAMVAVGYDDRKRAFRLFNSWGPEWGENGLGWVSYESFKARVDEAYVVSVAGLAPQRPNTNTDTDPDPGQEPPAVKPSPQAPDAPEADAMPPELSPKGRKAFQEYLAARPHKAFAVADDGSYGWRSGRAGGPSAQQEATSACERHTDRGCRVINVDDRPLDEARPNRDSDAKPDRDSDTKPNRDSDARIRPPAAPGPIEVPGVSDDDSDTSDDAD